MTQLFSAIAILVGLVFAWFNYIRGLAIAGAFTGNFDVALYPNVVRGGRTDPQTAFIGGTVAIIIGTPVMVALSVYFIKDWRKKRRQSHKEASRPPWL